MAQQDEKIFRQDQKISRQDEKMFLQEEKIVQQDVLIHRLFKFVNGKLRNDPSSCLLSFQ